VKQIVETKFILKTLKTWGNKIKRS